jgi:peptide subunit release factor 1 (eRF1)
MNAAHIIGKKRNRLNRLQRRLTDKDMGGEQRNRMVARMSELTFELAKK